MKRRLQFQALEKRRLLTEFTPVLLNDFTSGADDSEFSHFHAFDDRLLFSVNSNELWQTNGTSDGTLKLADTSLRTVFHSELDGPSSHHRPVRLFNAACICVRAAQTARD